MADMKLDLGNTILSLVITVALFVYALFYKSDRNVVLFCCQKCYTDVLGTSKATLNANYSRISTVSETDWV